MNLTNSKQKQHKIIEGLSKTLPWYVMEYIDSQRRKLAPSTLINYCHDYIIFFNWLVGESIHTGNRADIPLNILEKLTKQQIESFLLHLEVKLDNSKLTVNRKLSALKSLFNYLQNKAETAELLPYIQRNVMAKIELNQIKEDQAVIAHRIGSKILRGEDEFEQFRLFVASDYGILNKENKKLYNFHNMNRERDTAIISLILGSGLRLSELTGSNIDDVDLVRCCIRVIRKGNKEQFVYFSEQAMRDLTDYLDIRESRYKIDKSEKPLFIAAPIGRKGTSRRYTPRSLEKMVEKYVIAFGKPSLTVHTLRHSFATRYHQENNDVPKLRDQLGHSSIQTTMIYTHLFNDELKKAVNKMDSQRVQ
jgi:site-specific recombinase XerD